MPTVTPIRYSFRSSLRSALWTFDVADDGLHWQAGNREGVVPFDQIALIRLSYRPVSMQRHRFRMDIVTRERRKLRVFSTTSLTLMTVERQDEAYRAFVAALHERVGAGTSFEGGMPKPLYWLGVGMLALVGAALGTLFIRALVEGSWQGAAFMAAFAALFGWQIGGFVWRNRPIVYSRDKLPAHLLP
jgi:hypothetical protein